MVSLQVSRFGLVFPNSCHCWQLRSYWKYKINLKSWLVMV